MTPKFVIIDGTAGSAKHAPVADPLASIDDHVCACVCDDVDDDGDNDDDLRTAGNSGGSTVAVNQIAN